MVLTQQTSYLPCYGGESSACYPTTTCQPCYPCSTGSVQMEKLVCAVQGFEDQNKKKSSRNTNYGASSSGANKNCKTPSQTCCCKAPCTLISSLLKKIQNTESPIKKKSLTCVIFTELCKLSGTDPSLTNDVKRNTALALAQKFGVWIDDMLEKKGTLTCPAMDIDMDAQKVMEEIFDCTCCVPKKEYPDRKATIDKKCEGKKKGKYKAPLPKKKKKGKKKKSSSAEEDAESERERLRLEAERRRLEEEALRAAKLAAEEAARLAAEAAANEAKAKAMAACKEAAAKRKQALQEKIMAKDREDDERSNKPDRSAGSGQKSDADKKGKEDEAENELLMKKRKKGDNIKGDNLSGKSNTQPTTRQCVCGGRSTKQTISALFCSEKQEPLTNCQSLDPNNSANMIEQYSKIVHHFLGTLDDMNDWIQNLVRETDQLIDRKLDTPNVNVLFALEQDWKVFKNKMFLKVHHWKYFNKIAKKMADKLEELCSCEIRMGSCPCPSKAPILGEPAKICCMSKSVTIDKKQAKTSIQIYNMT